MKKTIQTKGASELKNIVTLEGGDYFATVCIWKTEGGFSTEWWISSKFDYQLRVVASLVIPIWGDGVADVSNRIGFLRESVFKFVIDTHHENGDLISKPSKSVRYDIAWHHIKYHLSKDFPFAGISERAYAAFTLAEQFGVKRTAVLISDVLDKNIRTVNDWVYKIRSRKK
jgi:hypothetical protein